jgi:hypothetical protein
MASRKCKDDLYTKYGERKGMDRTQKLSFKETILEVCDDN